MSEPVQGFLAKITIDGNELTAMVESFSLPRSKNTLNKMTMNGDPDGVSIPGSSTGSLSVDGLIDQSNMALLEASWAKETEVAFQIEVDDNATLDLAWSGNVVLDSLDVSTSGDDVWRFSLGATTSGAIAVSIFNP